MSQKYLIRFNKTRGKPGRGSLDHVWRVFEGASKEYILKHIIINVPCQGERTGDEWNIAAYGILTLDRTTSTGTIDAEYNIETSTVI